MSLFVAIKKKLERILCNMRIRKNGVQLGDGIIINGVPLIHTQKGKLKIGDGTRINSGIKYNAIGGNQECSFITRENGEIIIGKNVGISNTAFVSQTKITIGDNVLIGGSCCIYDTDFHSLNYEERKIRSNPGTISRPVIIKKGAFIGAHTIILKGVTIGEKAIVGAGSVVTKSIGGAEIWAGNPARFIRYVDENKENLEKNYEEN